MARWQKLARWMERNLEQTFYQAEMARVELLMVVYGDNNKLAGKEHRHGQTRVSNEA